MKRCLSGCRAMDPWNSVMFGPMKTLDYWGIANLLNGYEVVIYTFQKRALPSVRDAQHLIERRGKR